MAEAESPIPQPPDHLSVLPPETGEKPSATDAVKEESAEAGRTDSPSAEADVTGRRSVLAINRRCNRS